MFSYKQAPDMLPEMVMLAIPLIPTTLTGYGATLVKLGGFCYLGYLHAPSQGLSSRNK